MAVCCCFGELSPHALEHVSPVLHRGEPSSWQRDPCLQGLATSVSPCSSCIHRCVLLRCTTGLIHRPPSRQPGHPLVDAHLSTSALRMYSRLARIVGHRPGGRSSVLSGIVHSSNPSHAFDLKSHGIPFIRLTNSAPHLMSSKSL